MLRFWRVLRHKWQFYGLVATALIAGGLQLAALKMAAHWVLGTVSLSYCIISLYTLWRDIQGGIYRVDILLPVSVVSALLAEQSWIAFGLVIVTHISKLVAQWVQARSRRIITSRATALPTTVSVVRGRKLLISALGDIHSGDKIIWQVGEVIPFDAVVLEGQTSCDETLLGGEVNVSTLIRGNFVVSGSRNTGETVTLKVQNRAADSYFQTTTKLLNKSVAEQTPFVRTSDRYSFYFTISALLIAGAAWYLSHQPSRFVAVMVVATVAPLLVPARLALNSAVVAASKRGIVLGNGLMLQKLAEAKTFAFGFTGIITEGVLALTNVTAFEPYSKNEVLGLAASLEQAIDHPLAKAVVAAAQAQGFNFTKAKHVQIIAGRGLKATLQGKEVLVGNASLLTEQHIQLPVKVDAKQLTLFVALDDQLVGSISFQDKPRASAKNTFESLQKLGVVKLIILSGAPQSAVAAAIQPLAKTELHSEASMSDKLAVLAATIDRPTVFVGNGAADSLLQTAADIGISLGTSSLQSGPQGPGVRILHDDLAYVALARKLVQGAFAISMQSILVGGSLSLLLMALAMSGKLPLVLGLALQAVINVSVTLYPLRVGSQAQY